MINENQWIPTEISEVIFAEPWQAHAFAIVIKLHERGVFTWHEWVDTLARHIATTNDKEASDVNGRTYYAQWLAALEEIVAHKGVTTLDELTSTACAWDNAAHRTPHGVPVELHAEDYPSKLTNT